MTTDHNNLAAHMECVRIYAQKFAAHPPVVEETMAAWNAILSSAEALEAAGRVQQAEPVGWSPASGMTAERATYFMERFKHEEKLLGPNEQAAVDFVLELLAAPAERAPAPAVADTNGETNVQLVNDSDPARPEQQRELAGSMALGQPVVIGQDAGAGDQQPQALLVLSTERLTELAAPIAEAIAKNCRVAPQLVFPYLFLGLKELLAAPAERAPAPTVAENLRQENDTITELNHAQWLALGKVRLLVAACNRIDAESEEFEFDDGMGRGILQVYWDEFADALDQTIEALGECDTRTHGIHVAPTAQEAEAPYGHCPQCGGKGAMRERSPNGETTCENGHGFPHARFDAAPTAREASKPDPWHKAVLDQCMVIEGGYVESDPEKTVASLIDWHILNERRANQEASKPVQAEAPSNREERMVVIERNAEGRAKVWCDPEIADLVRALNAAQLATVWSCSGHGFRPGLIGLEDGRSLFVADAAQTEIIQRAFPLDVNGDPPAPSVQQAGGGEAWRDRVEQRIRTWKQRTMNKSGDMLAIDDFIDKESLDDLVDFVCDEWAAPPPQQADAPSGTGLRVALQFYAEGNHFTRHDPSAWDTVSGEPANFYEDESNTATVEDGSIARAALSAQPAAGAQQAAPSVQAERENALREFFAVHAAETENNPYAYCEVAYTRTTGWMAWITDKPLAVVVESPDRKVLMRGQGDTPEEAAANAIQNGRAALASKP